MSESDSLGPETKFCFMNINVLQLKKVLFFAIQKAEIQSITAAFTVTFYIDDMLKNIYQVQ